MRTFVIAAFAALAASSFAQAFFSGSLNQNSPTFNRPSGLTTISGVGTAVAHSSQPFYVSQNGNYLFETAADAEDTYILIYKDAFTPSTPLTNLIALNDDFNLSSGSYTYLAPSFPVTSTFQRSRIASVALTAGTQYYAINTTFGNGEFFNFESAIGPVPGTAGRVTLGVVPEPATMLALGAGLAGLAARRRRKA